MNIEQITKKRKSETSEKISSISKQIEELKTSKKVNYLEAIMLWCKQNDIETEEIAHLIKKDPELKAKLQMESEGNHLLKSSKKVTEALTPVANSLLI